MNVAELEKHLHLVIARLALVQSRVVPVLNICYPQMASPEVCIQMEVHRNELFLALADVEYATASLIRAHNLVQEFLER